MYSQAWQHHREGRAREIPKDKDVGSEGISRDGCTLTPRLGDWFHPRDQICLERVSSQESSHSSVQ